MATTEKVAIVTGAGTGIGKAGSRLCDAGLAGLWRHDDGALVGVAHYFNRSWAPVRLQRCPQNEPPGDADPGPAIPNFDAVGAREVRVV